MEKFLEDILVRFGYIFLFIVFALVTGYVGWTFWVSIAYQDTITFSFSEALNDYPVVQSKIVLLTPKPYLFNISIDNESAIEVGKNGLRMLWNLDHYLFNNKVVDFTTVVYGNNPLTLLLDCDNCTKGYKTFPLYVPLAKEVAQEPVFTKDGYTIYGDSTIPSNDKTLAEALLSSSLPIGSSLNAYNTDSDMLTGLVLDHGDIVDGNRVTQFPFTLRGSTNTYIISADSGQVQLKFSKIDLNRSAGTDNVQVVIADAIGQTLFTDTLDDVGGIDGSNLRLSSDEMVVFSELKPNTVYNLRLETTSDVLFSDLTINTSKVVIADTAWLYNGGSVFTKTMDKRMLYFSGVNRPVVISSATESGQSTYRLPQGETEQKRPQSVGVGEYYIQTQTSEIINGGLFSPTKDSFFYPYRFDLSNKYSASLLVFGTKYKIYEVGGKTYFTTSIPTTWLRPAIKKGVINFKIKPNYESDFKPDTAISELIITVHNRK